MVKKNMDQINEKWHVSSNKEEIRVHLRDLTIFQLQEEPLHYLILFMFLNTQPYCIF